MVLRSIPYNIPAMDTLGLPKVIGEIAMEERGLVLVTGITGILVTGRDGILVAGRDGSNETCGIIVGD